MTEIINRIANSPIITIDLEQYYDAGDRVEFDLKDYLFQDLVLKEKDFREALKDLDWGKYAGKHVAVFCSVDAIVPTWAFMLVMTYLEGSAAEVVAGDLEALEQYLFQKSLSSINPLDYKDRPVVVKGCSKLPVPLFAYGEVIKLLKGHAKSIMYGEPCSTVPLYKKPKLS
ncbi:MAG: DUF2480 family protein [Anditalea sp.]